MNRTVWSIFICVLAIALVLGAWVFWRMHTETPGSAATTATSTDDAHLAGNSIYANGEYGFSVAYPSAAKAEDTFSSYYHLANYWRANALPSATGTPIAAIIGYTTTSDHSYPRYFVAMVRIGASSDKREMANCLKVTPDQGETALPDTTINGTVWKTFSFESAGMMQYVKGVSYRTVHEGKCFALEKIQTGSSYRDDPANKDDVAQQTLDAAYTALDPIVQSFSFARP